jgi:hypothetical protein
MKGLHLAVGLERPSAELNRAIRLQDRNGLRVRRAFHAVRLLLRPVCIQFPEGGSFNITGRFRANFQMGVGSGCLAGASTPASGLGKVNVLRPFGVACQCQLPAVAACVVVRMLHFEGPGRLPWRSAIAWPHWLRQLDKRPPHWLQLC